MISNPPNLKLIVYDWLNLKNWENVATEVNHNPFVTLSKILQTTQKSEKTYLS